MLGISTVNCYCYEFSELTSGPETRFEGYFHVEVVQSLFCVSELFNYYDSRKTVLANHRHVKETLKYNTLLLLKLFQLHIYIVSHYPTCLNSFPPLPSTKSIETEDRA